MTGPILDAVAHGRVLWVDAMEARLHPNLFGAAAHLLVSDQPDKSGRKYSILDMV